jgi:exosome complex RNA-binding protein Csl4
MSFLSYLFGCSHSNYSWPIKRKNIIYVTCFDCGKELKYDWKEMKLLKLDTIEERRIRCDNYGQTGVIK